MSEDKLLDSMPTPKEVVEAVHEQANIQAAERLGFILLDRDEKPQVGDVVEDVEDNRVIRVNDIDDTGRTVFLEDDGASIIALKHAKIIQRQGKPAVYKGGVDE